MLDSTDLAQTVTTFRGVSARKNTSKSHRVLTVTVRASARIMLWWLFSQMNGLCSCQDRRNQVAHQLVVNLWRTAGWWRDETMLSGRSFLNYAVGDAPGASLLWGDGENSPLKVFKINKKSEQAFDICQNYFFILAYKL